MEVLRTDQILVRYDTLNSREDELVADAWLEFLQVALQIGWGCDEHQRVILLYDTVQVAVEIDFVDIEMDTGKIGRVMA